MTIFIKQLDAKIVLGITVLKIKKPDCRPRPSWWALISSRRNRIFRGIKFESNYVIIVFEKRFLVLKPYLLTFSLPFFFNFGH